jgi:capsular polysaccharide biosynthesis protein
LEELSTFVDLPSASQSTIGNTDELVLSLASRLDMVYYHWVTEQLPQVFALVEACKSLEKTPKVVLRKKRPGFQDSSLAALFPEIKIVDYVADMHVKHMMLSTIPTKGYAAHPVVLRLRERAFSILCDESDDGPKLIYVKRKIGGWRYILNENEVLDSLSKLGFTIIDAAEYSFVEQIQMFGSARCVVSIFGSGLTNILFCKSASIVELAGDYADPCFASISGHVGNTHIRLKCTSVGDNIIVNTEELHASLISLNILNLHS